MLLRKDQTSVRSILTICCAVLLLTGSAFASDSLKTRDGMGGMDKMKGGMPPMGPPTEMKQIAGMLGTWKADFQMRMDEKAPWMTSPATLVVTPILGGAANQGEFTTKMMGMEFKGYSRITFNRNTGKWQNSWIDNMGAYQTLMEGDFKDNKLSVMAKDRYMGREFTMRETTFLKSETEVEWTMETSYDDGETWFVNMKGTYTKQ